MTTTTLPPGGPAGPPEKAAPKEEQPYVEVGRKFERGESDPYLDGFVFDLPSGPTGDRDRPVG